MPVLTTQQRNTLESAVKLARKLAETGARNALQALAVNNPEPFAHMSPEQRTLRNRLRNKARLLGDELPATGGQQIDHLSYELAYENWHKMLFAKFLEANGLLMHTSGVAVTMEECEELAKEEGFADKWEAAAAYASKMLPAIFRPEDPVMQVHFASNDRIKLEEVLDGLDNYIFTADDALGWVYQYWQSEAKRKVEEEEKTGVKINGTKLPAKTQLFTEHYMVQFLIDNTIGAWWMCRNSGKIGPVNFDYLKTQANGAPSTEKFEDWPETTKDVTILDPCMGSGHFISSVFQVLAKLRIYEENLNPKDATLKVIKENIFGLELDARCTQIAAFNLALTAWKFCCEYFPITEMNLACSGIAPKGKKIDWLNLVNKEPNLEIRQRLSNGMATLYDHFQLAPELGSLLSPTLIQSDAFTANFTEVSSYLSKALKSEIDNDSSDRGVIASGIAKAGEILSKKYTLQITNVPYLKKGKLDEKIVEFIEAKYPSSKESLETVFLERMLQSSSPGGICCSVMPQNWVFLTSYKKLREKLLKNESWQLFVRLGPKAFQTPMWDFNVMLLIIKHTKPSSNHEIVGMDVSKLASATLKEAALKTSGFIKVNQKAQLLNPDSRVVLEDLSDAIPLLGTISESGGGASSFDSPRFMQVFWEHQFIDPNVYILCQSSPAMDKMYSGRSNLFKWENGKGSLYELMKSKKELENYSSGIWSVWSRFIGYKGICVGMMGEISVSLYDGNSFDNNTGVIIPRDQNDLPAIWAFCSSRNYREELRKIDQKLNVTSGTLIKVPFDLNYWKSVAHEKYPNGLPKPYSDDATQWLFHGNPMKADNPLHVAAARLLGYSWPAENDAEMELADEARELIKQIKAFDDLTDEDGILCIPPVNGELAASEKLRSYLQAVYGSEWSNNTIGQLLQKEGAAASNLEDWLRTSFFEQHCKLFQNRPFIWHIWDGRKDGFSALVNYHKLNKEALQRLIFTYLGDWIRQCEAKKKSGESGAEGLLSAALKLKEKLEAILEGEAPYDIFVRWKPLEQQPIGWEPDLNDGVRLNIRPFITADVLRKKLNIKWGVDRGKNPPGSFWGDIRDNDRHLSLEEKRKAR